MVGVIGDETDWRALQSHCGVSLMWQLVLVFVNM